MPIQSVQNDNNASGISSCEIRVSFNWSPPVLALLDCGAQANVMSYQYYSTMHNRPSLPLEENFAEQLSSVSGEPLEVAGVLHVPVRIAGTALRPDVRFFVVKDLPSTCTAILGMEFILEHLHAVYWQSLTYSLRLSPNVQYPLVPRSHKFPSLNRISLTPPTQPPPLSSSSDSTSRAVVMLVRSVIVRPRSSCLVNGTIPIGHPIQHLPKQSNAAHLFEPADVPEDSWEQAVAVPAAVALTNEVFPVLLTNRSGKYVRYKAGTVIGQLSIGTVQPPPAPKMVVHSSRIGQITVTQNSAATGADVIQLGDNITIDLSNTIAMTAPQRELLREMLTRNRAVFASDPKHTPTTSLTHHRIETGSHPPVYVPPYRPRRSRQRLDADFVLDQRAYDTEEAVRQSLLQPPSEERSTR